MFCVGSEAKPVHEQCSAVMMLRGGKSLGRSMGLNYMRRKYPRRALLGRIIFGALWVYCVSLHQDKTKIVFSRALRKGPFLFTLLHISNTQTCVLTFTSMIIDIQWLCFQMKTDAENREGEKEPPGAGESLDKVHYNDPFLSVC